MALRLWQGEEHGASPWTPGLITLLWSMGKTQEGAARCSTSRGCGGRIPRLGIHVQKLSHLAERETAELCDQICGEVTPRSGSGPRKQTVTLTATNASEDSTDAAPGAPQSGPAPGPHRAE